MIKKLLLSIFIATSMSACSADTDTSASQSISPKLQAKIAEINEGRDQQIAEIKAMRMSAANEARYIAEYNEKVDGLIAGLVMQEKMQPSQEELKAREDKARRDYEYLMNMGTSREQKRDK